MQSRSDSPVGFQPRTLSSATQVAPAAASRARARTLEKRRGGLGHQDARRTLGRARIGVLTGARPNLPKAATLLRGLRAAGLEPTLIHSGQHPAALGADFASALGLSVDVQLPGPPADAVSDTARLGAMVVKLGEELTADRYDAVVVIGDVNTAVAGALAAKRNGLRVIHLEAGLRSGRNDDPEEINRRAITALADFHLPSTVQAADNLRSQGIPSSAIALIGNTMAETFLLRAAGRRRSEVLERLGLSGRHVLLTVHKPPTVADPVWLRRAIRIVSSASQQVVFPMHPSLVSRHPALSRVADECGILVTEPLPYDDLGRLTETAACVVTDSAGLQEESTIAGVPCVTVGMHTARPETCDVGTNRFVGFDLNACRAEISIAQAELISPQRPALWDAAVSLRITSAVPKILGAEERVA